MPGERFVVLGLARPRAGWFSAVSQWATSAALPAELVRCVSVEELRARLASDRPFSAALLDGGLPTVDRDLVQLVRQAGVVAFVVDDGARARDWTALGASVVLPTTFNREQLIDALATHATLVGRVAGRPFDEPADAGVAPTHGQLVAVCGPGGTGASVVAAALAQGLAGRSRGRVVLADLCLRADQAMLHDVRDVTPGIQELVEAHRGGVLPADEVRSLTFDIVERRYHLLLGLRRARYWSALRPRSFDAAFDSLRRAYDTVVADVTADFEGEDIGGSADVEERNLMARTAVLSADVVFAVGEPGVKGIHALVRLLGELSAAGVTPGNVVPVVNRAPRPARARAAIASALVDLAGPAAGVRLAGPVFLPRRRVDDAVRDARPLPAPLPELLAKAFEAAVAGRPATLAEAAEPTPIVPGSLGRWAAQEAG